MNESEVPSKKHGGHVITAEDRLKKTGKKNPGMGLVMSIKNRKWCKPNCRIFWYCPMMPLSVSRANVDGACLLNKGGNVLIRRFLNLMAKGEDGLLTEITNTLFSYGFDIETAPPSVKKDYAMMCMQLHKQMYSDKEKAMEMQPRLTVVINEMGRDGQLREVVPVLEAGRISTANVSRAASEFIDTLETEDPESLASSPMVDELFKNLPKSGTSLRSRNTEIGEHGRFRRIEVPEPDNRAEDDESSGIESESKELEEAPDSPSDGT